MIQNPILATIDFNSGSTESEENDPESDVTQIRFVPAEKENCKNFLITIVLVCMNLYIWLVFLECLLNLKVDSWLGWPNNL